MGARITLTGNEGIDNTTSEIALALRAEYPRWTEQEVYNAAMNLRNDMLRAAHAMTRKQLGAVLARATGEET